MRAATGFEPPWVAAAATLGTASHFNQTGISGVLYMLAGAGAVILTPLSLTT